MIDIKKRIAILIIAAGESKRLGQAKQLLQKNGVSLLENSVIMARASGVGDLYLVLGARAELIQQKIQFSDINLIINEKWHKGMGESISCGMRQIIMKNDYRGVIISLADQPFLSPEIFNKVKNNTSDEKIIIKSNYEEGSGPPVYFSEHFFTELVNLSGDEGAKPLVKKHKKYVKLVDFPQGNIDIDKEEDLKYWS